MSETNIVKQNSVKLEHICRTCLTKDVVMINIFDAKGEKYHKMLMHCTQLVIKENDGLPNQLCIMCIADVSKLSLFKKQCENADADLRLYLKNSLCELKSLRNIKTKELTIKNKKRIDRNSHDLLKKKNLSIKKTSRLISKRSEKKSTDVNIKAIAKTDDSNDDDIVKYNDNFNNDESNSDDVFNVSKKIVTSDNNIKMKRISSATAFGCRKCDVHFLTWQELEKHNNHHIHEPNTQKLACRYCNKSFLHQRHINPHIRKMHSELERFQCGYCGNRWKDIRSLKIHLSTHLPEDKSPITAEMNKFDEIIDVKNNIENDSSEGVEKNPKIKVEFEQNDFAELGNISKEGLDMESTNLICYKCRQLFIDLESLQLHINTVHENDTVNDSKVGIRDIFIEIQGAENDKSISNNEAKKSDTIFNDDKNNISKNNTKNHHCSICNKFFKSSNDLKRHETTHDPDKPYHCKFGRCRWTFATEHDLDVHTNVNHSDGSFECRFCHKTFKHARNLRQHMSQHQLTKRFECKHCKKGFNHLHHLQNHERIHTGDMPFLCQECGRAFATKDRLIFHIRRHSDDRPFSCVECGKKFLTMNDLKVHNKTHSGDRPYMCSICGKTFTARYNLNKHARSQHVGSTIDDSCKLENFGKVVSSCNICGFNTETLQKLDQHMKSHTCQYFCPICPKSFSLTSALDAHINTHAMGDRSHKCDMCGWAFNRAEHLRAHIARRHTTEGRLTCKHCSCTFARAPDLTSHLRTHDHQRPYVCSECGRGFTQSGALRIHLRIHSGERPYICGICHKGHRSAGALAMHMRKHSTQLMQTDSQSVTLDVNDKDESADNSEHSTVIKHVTPVNTIDFQDLHEMQTMNKITTEHIVAHQPSLSLEQLVVDSDNINIIETVNSNGEIMFISEEN